MKYMLFPFLCISIILLSSCKKENNPVDSSDQNNSNILPLKSGNTWIMKVITYDSTGNISGTLSNNTSIVGRDTSIGDEKWYQLGDASYFWMNKSDGLWRRRVGPAPESPQLIYKYPANVGDMWTILGSPVDVEVSVSSTNEAVNVPAGSFSCYSYQLKLRGTSIVLEEDYLKAGIGWIAWNQYSRTSSGAYYKRYRVELSSYTLK